MLTDLDCRCRLSVETETVVYDLWFNIKLDCTSLVHYTDLFTVDINSFGMHAQTQETVM